MDKNNNKDLSLLSQQVYQYFCHLTKNTKVLELVRYIQSQLEKGHTAVVYDELINDPIISHDGSSGHIVLDDGLAGFRRLYQQESFIKRDFLRSEWLNIKHEYIHEALTRLTKIVNHQVDKQLDLQWQACISAILQPRFILSGGPGTGKTSTLIRVMLLYLILNPNKTIALAAPTGKAANRMMQSIHDAVLTIEIDESLRDRLLQPAYTIHRLLGYGHHDNKLFYHAGHLLPYDYVIVDEASMLDVSMVNALLSALKPDAQLLLMGDKNQLPPVEAGHVFTDLCQLLEQTATDDLMRHYLYENPDKKISVNASVTLKKNYRFEAHSSIAKACQYVISQDIDGFKSLENKADFQWQDPLTFQEKKHLLKKWYEQIESGESSILLSPVNYGHNGVAELNALAIDVHHPHHSLSEGMPIMVTKNDYSLGVFNGDIGSLYYRDHQWCVPFVIEGNTTFIRLDAINQWSVAYAISIHKSQGSEYDHVLIALPDDQELDILSNALLFTAISRARKSITLWSNEEIIDKTIKSKQTRVTFLK